MTWTIIEHTADVRLRVEAPSLAALFLDAMLGMFAIMHATPEQDARPVQRQIVIDAPDRTTLLVDFLNEVLSRVHIGGEIFDTASFGRLTETEARIDLSGVAPARFEQDVKAVTYHEAEVRHERGVWSTMLVFDI